MTSISKVLQPLRIIALPLTRTSRPNEALIYYHFQLAKSTLPASKKESEGSWSNWLGEKATRLWSSYGQAEKGSWKNRVYLAGERIVDRLDFEELALKGIDPSLGPTIRHPDLTGRAKDTLKTDSTVKIPLLYPSSVINDQTIISHLTALVQSRGPKHRRGFYTWMALTPLTAPLKLIPIIPNLPFFYCVWRSWHHYRAYRASDYVQALLEGAGIQPQPSLALDSFYRLDDAISTTRDPLLSRDRIPSLLHTFNLESDDALGIYRALDQAKNRAQTAKD